MNRIAKPDWPEISFEKSKATFETLHLWTQIAGKIRLAKMPWINHSWHVTLYVTPTGLTTSDIADESAHFSIDFNFIKHQLIIKKSSGEIASFNLENLSVAGFYKKIFTALDELKIQVAINPIPNEIENAIPLNQDNIHSTYNIQHAESLHKALLNIQEVFTFFRSQFKGKCSPVHFFWGSFDLAVSRFSGREAPKHPGGVPNLPDWIAQEAYSDEVCSCGFWPGNELVPFPLFYCYIYPEPTGFKDSKIKPAEAYYHDVLREFVLPYEVVQRDKNPSAILFDFLNSTYDAAANLAKWDKKFFEIKIKPENKTNLIKQ